MLVQDNKQTGNGGIIEEGAERRNKASPLQIKTRIS
jgi:hypothetical protein